MQLVLSAIKEQLAYHQQMVDILKNLQEQCSDAPDVPTLLPVGFPKLAPEKVHLPVEGHVSEVTITDVPRKRKWSAKQRADASKRAKRMWATRGRRTTTFPGKGLSR